MFVPGPARRRRGRGGAPIRHGAGAGGTPDGSRHGRCARRGVGCRAFHFQSMRWDQTAGSYQYAPELGQWLRSRRDDFDCLVTHGMWQHHGFAAWRAWRGARGPRFVFAHGMLDPWFKRTYPRKHLKKWLYWPWAEYRLLRSARAVFFTCEEERRLARESFWLYRTNEAVSTLGIEEPPGDGWRVAGKVLCAVSPNTVARRLILFLGRIAPKKGCDLLLRAFEKLSSPHPDAVLLMAGPGEPEYMEELKRLIPSSGGSVHWLGMLTGDAEMGRAARGGNVRAALASGELWHCRRGSVGVRQAGAHFRQGQHLARDRRGPGGMGRS